MKIKIKKVISVFLCVMIFVMIGTVNFAHGVSASKNIVDSGNCGLYGDNLKWIFYSDGELVISGNGEMNWYYVDHTNGGEETSRSAPWSRYYKDIAVITIEEGVTSIGNDALIGKNIQYYKVNLPKSLEYFQCLIDFDGSIYEAVKTYQTKGKHIAFCYAGTQAQWDDVVCKYYRMAVDEKTNEYDMRYRKSSTENRIAHTGYQDYMDMYFNGEEPVDFCKIQRTTSTVTINPFEKVELYSHYYVNANKDAKLIWTIEDKGIFLNGETDKTASGATATLLFLDDTTIKLQLVSSDGNVISEDEVFLKSYINKDTSIFETIKYGFLMVIITIVGALGGTIGPWIGSLL